MKRIAAWLLLIGISVLVCQTSHAPAADEQAGAGPRDHLLGWFKIERRDVIIPVFKRDGTYYSTSLPGIEVPFKECPEGLEWAAILPSMEGTQIGFDEASNTYYIAIKDSLSAHFSDGRNGVGRKEIMTRIDPPSGLLDPTAERPRTNDDFVGWYQGVWFPWARYEIRKDGERYLCEAQLCLGSDLPWEPHGGPTELAPAPDGLDLAFPAHRDDPFIFTYNDALKRFEVTKTTGSHVIRSPLARVPASPEEGAVLPPMWIGIPMWH